jgi:membrane-bound lytic murein transglycosylase MltF
MEGAIANDQVRLLSVVLCLGTAEAGNRPEKPGRTIQHRNLECLVSFYCRKYHVSEAWARAIIEVESDWNPRALSPKGAYGIIQLMPATASRFRVDRGISAENLEGGIKYLAWLKEHFKAINF